MIGQKNLIKQRVKHCNYNEKTCLVLNRKNQLYSVRLSDKVIYDGIKEKDLAFIRIINGIWIVTDFESKTENVLPAEDFDAEAEGLMGWY